MTTRVAAAGTYTTVTTGASDTVFDLNTTTVAEFIRDTIGAALVEGDAYVSITVNDGADTITFALDTAVLAELIRDTMGTALVGGTYVDVTPNDGADTITVEVDTAALDNTFLALVAAGAAVENIGAVEANVNVVAATGAAETLDVSVYGVHDITMDQNCTLTFSNPAPSGKCSSFILIVRGAFTLTLPASVDWPDATAATYSTPSVYVFTTVDAGTTWLGSQVGKAYG
jgi:hypothetical protein